MKFSAPPDKFRLRLLGTTHRSRSHRGLPPRRPPPTRSPPTRSLTTTRPHRPTTPCPRPSSSTHTKKIQSKLR